MKDVPDVDAMYATLARLKGTTVEEEKSKTPWYVPDYRDPWETMREPRRSTRYMSDEARSREVIRRRNETLRMVELKYGWNGI